MAGRRDAKAFKLDLKRLILKKEHMMIFLCRDHSKEEENKRNKDPHLRMKQPKWEATNNSPKAMSSEGSLLKKLPNTAESVISGHMPVDAFLKITIMDSN